MFSSGGVQRTSNQLTGMRAFDDGGGVDDVAEAEAADEVLVQLRQRHSRQVVHHCISCRRPAASSLYLPPGKHHPGKHLPPANIISYQLHNSLTAISRLKGINQLRGKRVPTSAPTPQTPASHIADPS